jgi:hypothetical protein
MEEQIAVGLRVNRQNSAAFAGEEGYRRRERDCSPGHGANTRRLES